LDFSEVLLKPGSDVFIFLDPPYYSADKLYGRNGELHNFPHGLLADLLKETRHDFLITYDDCESIRKLYKWANLDVTKWKLTYGMNNCGLENSCKVGEELFISNF